MGNKRNCTIFMDLYSSYISDEVEDETIEWMNEHLNQCSNCSKWSENYRDDSGLSNESNHKYLIVEDDEIKVIKRARIFLVIGLIIVITLALWMSIWVIG